MVRLEHGSEGNNERRERLGEAVGVSRVIRHLHLGCARKFGRTHALPATRIVHQLADLGRRQCPRCQIAQRALGDFRDKKYRRSQITPASS